MAKFNTPSVRPAVGGPIRSESSASGRTFEGGAGYARDAKSELFLLAVTNMVSEATFYETAGDRDSRFADLVRTVAMDDLDWLTRFGRWLRAEANMRSAALVLAAEATRSGIAETRPLVAAVLQRPDEPGEILAYWITRYGRALPMPVKRGVADAVGRLYNERAMLKYDTGRHAVRFADVIRLVHAKPIGAQQALFPYLIGRRLGLDLEIPAELETLRANAVLRAESKDVLGAMLATGELTDRLREAGMTWEDIPALIPGEWSKNKWEAIIPSMGYMAMLRNLRNFDQAFISDEVATTVAERLADPEQVARARQFPMRFLSAYNAAPSLRWSWPLDRALEASVRNIPELTGRTLVLVDTSSSMDAGFSQDGSLHRWDAAALFGLALARRCETVDVVSFSSAQYYANDPVGPRTKEWSTRKGESLLTSLQRWKSDGYFLGGGTETALAVAGHYREHDRVVILTDEQAARSDVSGSLPETVPLYTWNLAGYARGHAANKANRWTFGGLTDAGFQMIPLMERGTDADWPF